MTRTLSPGFEHRIGKTPLEDNHHWFFPWSDFKVDDLALQFRNTPCARTSMDYDVHRGLHHIYFLPSSGRKQGELSRRHMRVVIDRHRSGVCGCYQSTQARALNVFHLADTNFGAKLGEPLPPCCTVRVDRYVAKLVRARYAIRRGRFQSLPLAEIVAEHEFGRCACGSVKMRHRVA